VGGRNRELYTDDCLDPSLASRPSEAHGATQVVMIGESQRLDPQLHGLPDQGLRCGSTIEE
jgi:hypothetical protein